MSDLIRTVIVGFVSGVIGAIFVLAIAGSQPASAPQAQQAAGDYNNAVSIGIDATIDAQPASLSGDVPAAEAIVQEASEDVRPIPEDAPGQRRRYLDRQSQRQERFETRLREAGWTDMEIEALEEMRLKESLAMEQQQYEQMRKSLEQDPAAYENWRQQRRSMRYSMSDEKYEQYLRATGQTATVSVSNVIGGSAADLAGLQPGDEIVRYGSERVFDKADLMMAIVKGEPGEIVTVEVKRDGATFHVSVPRGPLGTSDSWRPMMGY